jgi:DNA-binding NtrC family response regulator
MQETTVLLVDDEVDFRELLEKRLRKRHLELLTAGSGEEALAILAGQPVDVVVLDVRMPGIGGTATLREIKRLKPEVEVIMLTGHASVEVALEGMELGAFDYLLKPVSIDELLFKLQDAAEKKRLRAGPVPAS